MELTSISSLAGVADAGQTSRDGLGQTGQPRKSEAQVVRRSISFALPTDEKQGSFRKAEDPAASRRASEVEAAGTTRRASKNPPPEPGAELGLEPSLVLVKRPSEINDTDSSSHSESPPSKRLSMTTPDADVPGLLAPLVALTHRPVYQDRPSDPGPAASTQNGIDALPLRKRYSVVQVGVPLDTLAATGVEAPAASSASEMGISRLPRSSRFALAGGRLSQGDATPPTRKPSSAAAAPGSQPRRSRAFIELEEHRPAPVGELADPLARMDLTPEEDPVVEAARQARLQGARIAEEASRLRSASVIGDDLVSAASYCDSETVVRATCDECENEPGMLRCEACEETLCVRCAEILHPRYTMEEPNEHVAEGKIRPLRPGDSAGSLTIQLPEITDWPMTEADWARIRDLSQPFSVEAPLINDLSSKARSDWPFGARFRKDDYVVFSILANDENEPEDTKGISPPWREAQGYGRVLTYTSNRFGPTVPASRRLDGHEICYVVEFGGLLPGDYVALSQQQEEVESFVPFRVAVVGGDKPDLVQQAQKEAFARDLKVRAKREELIMLATFRVDVSEKEGDGDGLAGKKRSVILLSEDRLSDPREKQREYLARRLQALRTLMHSCHLRAMKFRARPALCRLKQNVSVYRLISHTGPAILIQSHVRRFRCRHTLDRLRRELAERMFQAGRALHEGFAYLHEESKIKTAYSVNNKDFFPTLRDLKKWWRLARQKIARQLVKYLRQKANESMGRSFRRWKAWSLSLAPAHIDMDPSDEFEDLTIPSITPSHHPAFGLASLPPLPRVHAHREKDGSVAIESSTSYNSFVAASGGPTRESSWVIRGLVLMGAPPVGSAWGTALSRTAPEEIVLAGVGTFVCLLSRDELLELERAQGLKSGLEADLRFQLKSVRGTMQAHLLDAENTYASLDSDLKILMERHIAEDPTLEVKQRDKTIQTRFAFDAVQRAKAAIAKIPASYHWVHFPMEKGRTPDDADLVQVLHELERRLKDGHRLYIFSKDGHGRAGLLAGCLLGRIYSCPAEETLERLQFYHDSRPALRSSERAGGPKLISCPQTYQQAQQVRRILLMRETEYEPKIVLQGPPIDRQRLKSIQRRRRREGFPVYEDNVTQLDEQSLSDGSAGQDKLGAPGPAGQGPAEGESEAGPSGVGSDDEASSESDFHSIW
jgi:hypothetical protein